MMLVGNFIKITVLFINGVLGKKKNINFVQNKMKICF